MSYLGNKYYSHRRMGESYFEYEARIKQENHRRQIEQQMREDRRHQMNSNEFWASHYQALHLPSKEIYESDAIEAQVKQKTRKNKILLLL